MFYSEIYEIFKNTFSYRTPPLVISVDGFSGPTSVSDVCTTFISLLLYKNKIIEVLLFLLSFDREFILYGIVIPKDTWRKQYYDEDFFSIGYDLFFT